MFPIPTYITHYHSGPRVAQFEDDKRFLVYPATDNQISFRLRCCCRSALCWHLATLEP